MDQIKQEAKQYRAREDRFEGACALIGLIIIGGGTLALTVVKLL